MWYCREACSILSGLCSHVVLVVAEISDREHRVEVIRDLVAQLPDANRDILCILIQHLSR